MVVVFPCLIRKVHCDLSRKKEVVWTGMQMAQCSSFVLNHGILNFPHITIRSYHQCFSVTVGQPLLKQLSEYKFGRFILGRTRIMQSLHACKSNLQVIQFLYGSLLGKLMSRYKIPWYSLRLFHQIIRG